MIHENEITFSCELILSPITVGHEVHQNIDKLETWSLVFSIGMGVSWIEVKGPALIISCLIFYRTDSYFYFI